MEKERNEVIDICKGIGIILVIMGHIGFGAASSHIAHAFHLPMFFFVSGFLLSAQAKPGREFLSRKAAGLLIPYLVFGLVNYLLWLLIQQQKNSTVSLSPLGHLFWENTTGMTGGSIWFLPALFTANALFYLIRTGIDRVGVQVVVTAAISLLGIAAAGWLPFRLPYAIDAGMVGLGMLGAGFALRQNRERKGIERLFRLSRCETMLGLAAFAALALFNGEINMRKGLYHHVPLFWLNALSSVILVYNLSGHLLKLKTIPLFSLGLKAVSRIGKNSLIYVCMNDLVIVEALFLLKLIFVEESRRNTVIVHSLVLVVTLAFIEATIRYTPLLGWLDGMQKKRIREGGDSGK